MSRKFSQKFHDFFETVILKGKALGDVTHHFYKKEYQARGAPHYHILLWIDGVPVAGTDDDDVVLQWIQERITCRIPEEDSNPELHHLVTKYQRHKCNNYCRRRKRVKGTYITQCRFGFPRPTCDCHTTVCGRVHEIVSQKNVQAASIPGGDQNQQLQSTAALAVEG